MIDKWRDEKVLAVVGRPSAHAHLAGLDGRPACRFAGEVEPDQRRSGRQTCLACKRARETQGAATDEVRAMVQRAEADRASLRREVERLTAERDEAKAEAQGHREEANAARCVIDRLNREAEKAAAAQVDLQAKVKAAKLAPKPSKKAATGASAAALEARVAALEADLATARDTAVARGKEKRRIERELSARIEELEADNASQSRSIAAIRRALSAESSHRQAKRIVDEILSAVVAEGNKGAK